MIKILIVDDHPLILEGIKALLVESDTITVVGTTSNAFDAIAFLKGNTVDIALLDINLPDISGIELCKKIKEEFLNVRCIALSTFSERSYISRMIQNGAMGYLLKNSSREEILTAIQQVYGGGYFMNVNLDESIPSENLKPSPFLTPREKEVLELIAEGLTNQQIADQLFVSVLTINSHRKNLLTKFEVNNTASLIKLAAHQKLI
jgi:DNA-binding NarL/FixJ family response regulator